MAGLGRSDSLLMQQLDLVITVYSKIVGFRFEIGMVIDTDLGPIRSHDRFGESLRAMGMAVGMVPGVGFEQTPGLGQLAGKDG